jgi:outer membrane protein TolC
MSGWILALALLQAPADTVTLEVDLALERGLEVAPALEAATQRLQAATRRAEQATPWPNPLLSVLVENLGQSETFTGIPGARGLEGQAVLTAPLPIGKERSGALRLARAEASIADAATDATSLRTRGEILQAIGVLVRDQMLASTARDEAVTLEQVADALALQAEAGRTSDGDAARARLAAGMAATRLGRRESMLAVSSAELARRLGYSADTVLRLSPPVCTAPASSLVEGAVAEDGRAPELRVADARVEAARGATDVARGVRLPDFAPQVGVRRSGGNTGLYVGLATFLPLFDRGSARVGASVAEEAAAEADRRDAEQRWAAALAGAEGTVGALARAGATFDAGWFAALERTVEAADARYRLGEGTLFELLDSRRARLQALEDFHAWQAEWWHAQAEVERLRGRAAPASIVCTHPLAGRGG